MCMFIYSNSVGNIYSNNHYIVYGVLFLLFLFLLPDKLDGFKKRRRRGTGGDDEEEEEGEGLSLTEYLERKEAEYSKRGKPKKKRVSQLLIIIITINICGGHCS